MSRRPFFSGRPRRAVRWLAAGLALGGAAAQAQVDVDPVTPLGEAPQRYRPLFTPPAPAGAPRIVLDGAYAANAQVGRLAVEVHGDGAPADGVTPVEIVVRVFDRDNRPLEAPVLLTIEVRGGARVRLPGARTDEGGADRRDADRAVPGTQLRVTGGQARFSLIAPSQPEDVALRLSAGEVEVAGTIGFEPDVREMVAAGLIEGVIGRTSRRYEGAISPARTDDGFETELRSWSRGFDHGRGQVAARTALFLKGKIRGDRLLTLAYDSDKDTSARLLKDVLPEAYYPVYGDASVRTHGAPSSSRLYVRVDEGRHFAMYGDFSTGEGTSAAAGGGVTAGTRLRQLGSYQRTMTGAKLHRESADGFLNVFASRDTLRHVTEEIAANGTSGPFATRSTQVLENSEQVQLVVRDRNNLNTVLSVTTLVRLVDYSFEPFSGRILLTRPMASQDANGNPVHLRISYELDQAGEAFWLVGADGQINLDGRASVGGALVEDRNPQAPFRLASAHAGVKLTEHTELIAEVAQTDASLASVGSTLSGTPVLPESGTARGRAARVVIDHHDDRLGVQLRASRTGASFANTAAGAQPGSEQLGASAAWKADDDWTLKAELSRTLDTGNGASVRGASLGADHRLARTLTVGGGLRRIEERGRLSGTLSSLSANPTAGSYYASDSSTLLNANSALASTGAAPGSVDDLDTTTAFADLRWQASERWTLKALAEASVDGEDRHRVELGASYQLAERARLYARAEHQAGLSSRYALDSGSSRGQAIALGIDGRYMEGGDAFSEYRLRDASDGRASQLATGLRNIWQLKEGLAMTTGLERLRILDGTGQNATAATVGADWTASEWWKLSGRLEWRRLESVASSTSSSTTASTLTAQDSWLSTLTAVRRLDRDWTALARNYYLATDNHGARANGWQDRFQVGLAWRPADHNRIDVLAKYEYKVEDNINATDEWRRVHVGAVQANVHPERAWWASGRLAGKTVVERFPSTEGGVQDSYRAWLVGGRLIRDLTERWDLGLQMSLMRGHAAGQTGASWQRSVGVEVGYLVQSNLWLSAGYNASGFTDRDLSSDYTARGAYLRLRFKFDADLFAGADPVVNRALPR
ncbi:hypothetical protein X805_26640 [Sphaerotilus natans subsp. natans DSM 6575]|uniref:Outer membrane protein beta-barrel domain-containing protein n=1 Tax=Sphaerotilus natans subsp. natans DSM 6575 TaxID=1286631 RepID=A0A059KKI9_9BURK|nr:hypothetical protein [Sphaerotilus natans]KDB51734.1 hypothetical protein X805_26640 [Sphaerotilus natans subsp. natans DSM 6575]SIR96813.1 hypothetical protein SAMN05421778_12456 [Sphaerotilus natans]